MVTKRKGAIKRPEGVTENDSLLCNIGPHWGW